MENQQWRIGTMLRGALVIMLLSVHQTVALPKILMGSDPACGTLPYGQCQLRLQKCQEVKGLTQGTSGPVKDVFDCATLQGIPKAQVVMVLPAAFQMGQPETIMDRVIVNDTAAAAKFRRCVLTAAGVVTLNGTLDRMALISKLQMKVTIHPLLMDVVAAAINECPEPEQLKVAKFMTCVRKACIQQMPESIVALPPYGAFGGGDDDDRDDHKKCKKGKKEKGCKKH